MDAAINNSRIKTGDLLFSRTDERGVIEAGNEVFQRVSVYSWEKLIGAPHKILRHPDMPSGVFYIMWDAIKNGDPVGAYVQNMAEDGVPYWVFAAVLPVPGGYMSLRLKPTGPILRTVLSVYQQLRAQETEQGLKPADSATRLIAILKDHGYADYGEFMSYALQDEMKARDVALERVPNPVAENLSNMLGEIRQLENAATDVETTFKNTHQIPYNMRLQAGRLEGSDGPISVISSNHRQMTQKLEENLTRFAADSRVGAEAINLARFKTCAALLVDEMSVKYAAETSHGPEVKAAELDRLKSLEQIYQTQSLSEVRSLTDKVRRFGYQCRDMRRMMSGLELTRIMCKIERSKFDEEHAGLDEIVNRLAEAQESLSGSFDTILTVVSRILDRSENIQRLSGHDEKMDAVA